jgi:glutamate N-acetyltransferase/amino-acid N-acetyltransferase
MASGVFCDIKRLGTGKGSNKGRKRDLAIIASQTPAAVAGMFTTNQICAAPVKVCAERVRAGVASAIVVNSGNANACTGRQGLRDAVAMTGAAAKALGVPAHSVFVGSTGRIGVTLPMANVRVGIRDAAASLGDTPAHAEQAAEAILTSDTRAKQVALIFNVVGKSVVLGLIF